ncbi:hypothetical protein ACMD2_26336, partial [Ananas comosus]
MLAPLPRLTNSLRGHYDVDRAYLHRKTLLRSLKSRRSHDDSALARKLVSNWDEASLKFVKHINNILVLWWSWYMVRGTVNLRWLKDACDMIVKGGGSLLSGDELAMALSRVLLSNKAGDEIAADLLDLVGDGAFETVQDLLAHRKELVDAIQHGLLILKSEKMSSSSQPRMPSYGTQ